MRAPGTNLRILGIVDGDGESNRELDSLVEGGDERVDRLGGRVEGGLELPSVGDEERLLEDRQVDDALPRGGLEGDVGSRSAERVPDNELDHLAGESVSGILEGEEVGVGEGVDGLEKERKEGSGQREEEGGETERTTHLR